jgi:hypothetical protein
MFYHTTIQLGIEALPGMPQIPTLVMLKNYDDKKVYYTGGITKDGMTEFIKKNYKPWLSEFDAETQAKIFKPSGMKAAILFRSKNSPDAKSLDEIMSELAHKEKSEEFYFIKSDINEGTGQKLAKILSIKEADLPKFVIVETKKKFEKYMYDGKMLSKSLIKFVQEWKETDLAANSEEEPKENKGPVYKFVGRSFVNKVVNADTNVLVLFCNEDGEECKKAQALWKTLGDKYKDNGGIKIGYIDISKNKVVGIDTSKLPTIKLFLHNDKNGPMTYTEELEPYKIEGYLETNCLYKYRMKHDL